MAQHKIRPLPADVKAAIRTGVALTGFAQVVEELVLNSIDAGATSIAVRVDLPYFKVQVVDNGSGISADQFSLVGERYSTSKCHSAQDLEHLCFFGYRGEALASLACASSLLEITSRSASSCITNTKRFLQGQPQPLTQASEIRPCQGTTITAFDLFHNLPVRRKRLNEALEMDEIRYRVAGIALVWPKISISLRNDSGGHVIIQTHKSSGPAAAFSNIFTPARARRLMEVGSMRNGDVTVSGLVSTEGYSRKDLQFVFVNRRLVLKSSIHKQVNKILGRSLILRRKGFNPNALVKLPTLGEDADGSPTKQGSERHGIYIISIECPYKLYDITFDPRKTLVEFRDWPKIIHLLQDFLYPFLRKHNLLSTNNEFDLEGMSSEYNDKNIDIEEYIDDDSNQNHVPVKDSGDDNSSLKAAAQLQRYGRNVCLSDTQNGILSKAVCRPRVAPMISETTHNINSSHNMENGESEKHGSTSKQGSEQFSADQKNINHMRNLKLPDCSEELPAIKPSSSFKAELQNISVCNDIKAPKGYLSRPSRVPSSRGQEDEHPLPSTDRPLQLSASDTQSVKPKEISLANFSGIYRSPLRDLREAVGGKDKHGSGHQIITNTLQQLRDSVRQAVDQMGDPYKTPDRQKVKRNIEECVDPVATQSSPEKQAKLDVKEHNLNMMDRGKSQRNYHGESTEIVKKSKFLGGLEKYPPEQQTSVSSSSCDQSNGNKHEIPSVSQQRFHPRSLSSLHQNAASFKRESSLCGHLPSSHCTSSSGNEINSSETDRFSQHQSKSFLRPLKATSSSPCPTNLTHIGLPQGQNSDLISSRQERRCHETVTHSSKLAKLMMGEVINSGTEETRKSKALSFLHNFNYSKHKKEAKAYETQENEMRRQHSSEQAVAKMVSTGSSLSSEYGDVNSHKNEWRGHLPSGSSQSSTKTKPQTGNLNNLDEDIDATDKTMYRSIVQQQEKLPSQEMRTSSSQHEKSNVTQGGKSNNRCGKVSTVRSQCCFPAHPKRSREFCHCVQFDERKHCSTKYYKSSSKTLPFSKYKDPEKFHAEGSPTLSVVLSIPLHQSKEHEQEHSDDCSVNSEANAFSRHHVPNKKNEREPSTLSALHHRKPVLSSSKAVLNEARCPCSQGFCLQSSGSDNEENTSDVYSKDLSPPSLSPQDRSALNKVDARNDNQSLSPSPFLSQGFSVQENLLTNPNHNNEVVKSFDEDVGHDENREEEDNTTFRFNKTERDSKSPVSKKMPGPKHKSFEKFEDPSTTDKAPDVETEDDRELNKIYLSDSESDTYLPVSPPHDVEDFYVESVLSSSLCVQSAMCHKYTHTGSKVNISQSQDVAEPLITLDLSNPREPGFGDVNYSATSNSQIGTPKESSIHCGMLTSQIENKILHTPTLLRHLSVEKSLNSSPFVQSTSSTAKSCYFDKKTLTKSGGTGDDILAIETFTTANPVMIQEREDCTNRSEEIVPETENLSGENTDLNSVRLQTKSDLVTSSSKESRSPLHKSRTEDGQSSDTKEITSPQGINHNNLEVERREPSLHPEDLELSLSQNLTPAQRPRYNEAELLVTNFSPITPFLSAEKNGKDLLGLFTTNIGSVSLFGDSEPQTTKFSVDSQYSGDNKPSSKNGPNSQDVGKIQNSSRKLDNSNMVNEYRIGCGNALAASSVTTDSGQLLTVAKDGDDGKRSDFAAVSQKKLRIAQTDSLTWSSGDQTLLLAEEPIQIKDCLSEDSTPKQNLSLSDVVLKVAEDIESVEINEAANVSNLKNKTELMGDGGKSVIFAQEGSSFSLLEKSQHGPSRTEDGKDSSELQCEIEQQAVPYTDIGVTQTFAVVNDSQSQDCLLNEQPAKSKIACWHQEIDELTGKKIFVNNMSGHTISEDQWPEMSSQLLREMTTVQTSAETLPDVVKEVKELSSSGKQMLANVIKTHMSEADAEAESKWRGGKRFIYEKETGLDVSNLLSRWNNPTFLNYKPASMCADLCPSSGVAKSCFNSLSMVEFTKSMLENVKVIGQVDNKFIACEITHIKSKKRDGLFSLLVLFDQHAVHERVRLEYFTKDCYLSVDGQRTMSLAKAVVNPPHIISLDQDDVRILKAFSKEFLRIGVTFRVEEQSRTTVQVTTLPACLLKGDIGEGLSKRRAMSIEEKIECLIKEHIDLLKSTNGACGRLPLTVHNHLCSVACHGAVKFGDELKLSECQDLLSSLAKCDLPFQCAHGRPSVAPIVDVTALQKELTEVKKKPSLWKLKQV